MTSKSEQILVYDEQFNDISYVELNKRRRGDAARHEGDKLVNRMNRPKVKKIYVKKNGEDIYEKLVEKTTGFRV